MDKSRTRLLSILALASGLCVLMLSGLASATATEVAELFHWDKPAWAPTPSVPKDNPMTAAKISLGRDLFYDKRLSADGSMSCGSCHQQSRAFTDGQSTHLGVTGVLGIRNSMTLTNVAFLPNLTWANPLLDSLEKQMLVPLLGDAPLEMGMAGHDVELTGALNADPIIQRKFAEAFPDDLKQVSLSNVVKAISAFERTLLSFDSPYDRYKHGDVHALSASAKRGESLFFGERLECYHCHGGSNFTDNNIQKGQVFPEKGFHNTGLYNEDGLGAYKAWDHGLRDVTSRKEDEGAFRTPTLRNVAVTAPYMHDGSLPDLDTVIRKHYAIKGHAALSKYGANPLRSDLVEGFTINDVEVKDLIAFLNSLTDESFLANQAFSNPADSLKAVKPSLSSSLGSARASHATR